MVTTMQLTRKETELLKDLKGQEKLCVEKYSKHASCAKDSQLKDLFKQIGQVEQGHLDTLSQIESGAVSQSGGGQSQSGGGSQSQSGGSQSQSSGGSQSQSGGGSQSQSAFQETYSASDTADKQADSYLCTDVLAMEKHASHGYDVCVFEFKDDTVRDTLNHIQKEEQEHGKMIYDYMEKNHMYS